MGLAGNFVVLVLRQLGLCAETLKDFYESWSDGLNLMEMMAGEFF
jgi:hypothetical protein